MIKKIFLPERIGQKRILSQRIVGLNIQHNCVYASVVYAKRSKVIVENLLKRDFEAEELDEKDSSESAVRNDVQALKTIVSYVGKYDQIRVAIPASIVIFKEIEVPFVEIEKIRMILDYEIESMLPFSVDEAIIDFIVTDEKKDENKSLVLVAAVRKQDLKKVLDLYVDAGIEPSGVTIDLFAAYGLYQQISEYFNIPTGSALIDIGDTSTWMAFIQNGKLRITRYIQRGISHIIQQVCDDTQISYDLVLEQFNKFGVKPTGDDEFDKSFKKHAINFFNDIQFTLNSFSLKLGHYEGVNKILFLGQVATVNGIVQFSSDILQIKSEIFDSKKLFLNKQIKNKVKNVPEKWSDFAIVLGTALPSNQQLEFNLRRQDFALIDYGLAGRQLVTAAFLIFAVLTFIGVKGYIQISDLQRIVKTTEQQQVKKLIGMLSKKDKPKIVTLKNVVAKAEKLLKEKHELWTSFGEQRTKPLDILQDITKTMDKRRYDIDIEDFSITEKKPGNPIVEVSGYFKSDKGIGFHHRDWAELDDRFKESLYLTKAEPSSAASVQEKGLKFTVKLKKKEV
jgi:Tfp pilus assembly PilM family ATPase